MNEEALHRHDMELRRRVLLQAAKAVCSWCAGQSFPDDDEARIVRGPSSAANYWHRHSAWAEDQGSLCGANGIHHLLMTPDGFRFTPSRSGTKYEQSIYNPPRKSSKDRRGAVRRRS